MTRKPVLGSEYLFSWNDFVIISNVGEGSFARVTEASSDIFVKNVALRTLKVTENAAVNKRKFQLEAKMLLQLRHPNVARCFGLILSKPTYVLEFCVVHMNIDGENVSIHSLTGLIQTLGDDLPLKYRLDCIADIASALTYLHNKKVIVGDLKPGNVLLSQEQRVVFKLSDLNFNLSKDICAFMSTSYNLSQNGLVYTLLYIAPELITAGLTVNGRQTYQTDIFAFSVVMFQVLFPEIAITSYFVTPVQLIEALKKDWRPVIPWDIVHNKEVVYKEIVHVMVKCWSKDPSQRPTASIIYDAVENISRSADLSEVKNQPRQSLVICTLICYYRK